MVMYNMAKIECKLNKLFRNIAILGHRKISIGGKWGKFSLLKFFVEIMPIIKLKKIHLYYNLKRGKTSKIDRILFCNVFLYFFYSMKEFFR